VQAQDKSGTILAAATIDRDKHVTQPFSARQGHPYYMHDAIHRQPEALADMLRRNAGEARRLAELLVHRKSIHLAGIGTSWHAALVAQHWFRQLAPAAPPVHAWHSFEFFSYPPPLGQDDAVIVISHRGTKTYSFQALELAHARGAYTVAVTATNPGPRIMAADMALQTVEQERSAAFTVSYTSALMVLALIALGLGEASASPGAASGTLQQLRQIPGAVADALAREQAIAQTASRFASQGRFLSVAWGPNTANAYEVALKIKETSAADSEGIQAEQLLHGPFCSVDSRCLLLLVAPPGPGSQRAGDIARAAAAAGAPVWGLLEEGNTQLARLCTEAFALPPVPEIWSPLLYVAPLQLFTYHLTLARDANPDLFQQDNPRQAAACVHYSL